MPLTASTENLSLQDKNRYFVDEKQSDETRQPLNAPGNSKLSRNLLKIDQLKANLNLCAGLKSASSSVAIPCASDAVSAGNGADADDVDDRPKNIDDDVEQLIPQRPKLGRLPSYIPIG